jgi:hypothetical protein
MYEVLVYAGLTGPKRAINPKNNSNLFDTKDEAYEFANKMRKGSSLEVWFKVDLAGKEPWQGKV